jgi:hypothetical protein
MFVLAGIFKCGMVLVVGILVVPPIMPIMPLEWFILELGDGVSVELLGLL